MSLKLSLLTFIFSFSRSIKVWGGGGWRGVWALDYMFFKFSGEFNKQMLFNSLSVDSLGFPR